MLKEKHDYNTNVFLKKYFNWGFAHHTMGAIEQALNKFQNEKCKEMLNYYVSI